jgi:hypothetical protein
MYKMTTKPLISFSKFTENENLDRKWRPNPESQQKQTFSPKSSEEWNPYNFEKIQTYIPLYSKLLPATSEQTTLETFHTFHDLYTIQVNGETKSKAMFIKFSPLLDPLRYLTGKYGGSTTEFPILKTLPQPILTTTEITNHPPDSPSFQKALKKIHDPNNVSYVDGFFYYLSSQLMHHHFFLHGIDFYGSFLSIQKKYRVNLYDDITYLRRYTYFNETLGKSYHIHDQTFLKYLKLEKHQKAGEGRSSRKHHKVKLDISSITTTDPEKASDILELLDIEDLSLDFQPPDSPQPVEIVPETLDNTFFTSPSLLKFHSKLEQEPSSSSEDDESSEPEEDEEDTEEDNTAEEHSDAESSDCPPVDDEENETLYAYVDEFPVQMICMEKCEGTLDQLFVDQTLNVSNYDTEGASMLFQVVASLIAYQKAFHFTHNDLHTNNIMWVTTPIKYIYYQIQGRNYRIPTYNRIYKIIDFGRAIYEFQGQRFCSDSFASPEGDASTQYNCEPYLVPNKPVIEPNPSFDLCRLACAIYDFVMDPDLSDDEYEEDTENDDEDDIHHLDKDLLPASDDDDEDPDEIWEDADSEEEDQPETQFAKTIAQWCEDDKGKNMLYKTSGSERYPCFKLYQMIARTVHKHIPIEQIHNPLFTPFLLPDISVKLKKNDVLINLDSILDYTTI